MHVALGLTDRRMTLNNTKPVYFSGHGDAGIAQW